MNPKNTSWRNYGGRGIGVFDEWRQSSKAFMEWALSAGWGPGLTIERKDNDGNYEPDNCRFVDRKTQNRNSRHNKLNPQKVLEIRHRLKCRETTLSIAADLKIANQTVSAIHRKHIWKDVE